LIRPKWFKYVACVIVYNSKGEILLGKRREGETEGGKWAILGGVGAFGESESRRDFARRELQYDVGIEFNEAGLRLLKAVVSGDLESLVLKDYFHYDAGNEEISATGNPKAPEEVRWFAIEAIREMQDRGEIAFDNYKILEEFCR